MFRLASAAARVSGRRVPTGCYSRLAVACVASGSPSSSHPRAVSSLTSSQHTRSSTAASSSASQAPLRGAVSAAHRADFAPRFRALHAAAPFSSAAAGGFTDAPSQEVTAAAATEQVVGKPERLAFQAETLKLLDIVARSLYTDREIFVRELISNASDALEKLRHRQVIGQPIADESVRLEIQIQTDASNNTLTITDTGIGMSKEELIENLGTIAHSGTQQFIKSLSEGQVDASNVIGQFGVGFYSTFMVSDNVKVYSRSATPGSPGYIWTSKGDGSYEIAEASGVQRGTKIVLHLNDKSKDFALPATIKGIVEKHSNFINFDIKLDGEVVNTVKALWTVPKNDISPQQHVEFYKFISGAYDEPRYNLHFTTDTPISLKSLLYIPQSHTEKFGMGRMDPGVNLFCRKVLIQSKMKGLLPDWLRFVRGVIDCEDLPLNLSREHLQDSALIQRLRTIITRRILKFLSESASADEAKYLEFFEEFQGFLKEGAVTDYQYKEELGKLMRMESSHTQPEKLTSLDAYVERMPKEQEEIFYLVSPRRDFAESSPYYEGFKKKGIEVLFLYSTLDDFVMNNIGNYKGKRLVSIESADVSQAAESPEVAAAAESELPKEQLETLRSWIKNALEDRVSSVKESQRLIDTPAIVIDHESASMRRMMRFVDPKRAPTLPKQQLEINPTHPLIKQLNEARVSQPEIAKLVLEQIFDNALVAAGLIDDARAMIPRLNKLMQSVLKPPTEK